ncbi:MAG: twin-arginine translocase subunit TatC [Rickettsiaceae bacterium]|nr:twin-arginine translocase subunit TatC [Rickettsiaceae bacterium]
MHKYTFREHFLELKQRIIKILAFFVLVFLVSYFYSETIYQILIEPLASIGNSKEKIRKVIYTGLAEAFLTYLKLSLFTAFLLTMPIISWELYRFIAPGLLKTEKKIAAFALFLSPILFFIGSFFVFYLVMPRAWYFFLSFENTGTILPLILEARISEYLNLVMQLITVFGLAFQMPIIMVILNILHLVSSKALAKKRRLAIVINFIMAAIFTPPDVLSQIALALPLILLYEVSIIMCKFIENRG